MLWFIITLVLKTNLVIAAMHKHDKIFCYFELGVLAISRTNLEDI